jgi:hypothetical protein
MFSNNSNIESLIPFLFASPLIYVIYCQNKIILAQKNELLQTGFFKRSYLAQHDLIAYYYNLYKSPLKTNFYLQNKKSALSAIQ